MVTERAQAAGKTAGWPPSPGASSVPDADRSAGVVPPPRRRDGNGDRSAAPSPAIRPDSGPFAGRSAGCASGSPRVCRRALHCGHTDEDRGVVQECLGFEATLPETALAVVLAVGLAGDGFVENAHEPGDVAQAGSPFLDVFTGFSVRCPGSSFVRHCLIILIL